MNIGEKFYCSKCMREIESEEICPYCGYDHSKENGPKMLEEGTLLHGGRYQIGAVIGSGGFGITYAAWDLVLNRPAAIKEYFPEDLCSRDAEKDYLVHPDAKYKDLYMIGLTRFTRDLTGLVPQAAEQDTLYTDGCSDALAKALSGFFTE